jgi:predicted SnoaL-like aldol condensation-catalyzing enzyme
MSSPSPRRLAAAFGLGLFLLAPVAQAADTDLAKNKALVQSFWNDVLSARNVDAATRYISPNFIQHDPQMPAGLKGFQDYFRKAFTQTPANFKTQILKTVAEGDVVVVYDQYTGTDPQGKPFTGTGFDMFRIENGMIAEHWDQVEPGP